MDECISQILIICEARINSGLKKKISSNVLSFPVIERFCLPPDAKVIYKDATGTEVDAEIFSDLVGQGNVVLTALSDDGEIYMQVSSSPLHTKE